MADNNEDVTNDDAAEDNAPGVQLENIDLDAAAAEVENTDVVSEMETSFLAYSLSVIMSRAIPDVRDGLKPVQRRVIYAMYESGLRPDKGYKKSVATVGEVMKKYHPHGDSSIYDTLVRLAQSWSMNVPLVDGHGNFGSPDDGPAAMRYCTPGHVRVRMADGTTRRLDQFVSDAAPNSDNDIDVKVVGKDGNPVRATQLFHSGDHETLRVTTRAGFQLEGTHNHPVLTLQNVAGVPLLQWKLMEELEPGDHVAMLRTEQPTMVHPTDNDLDLALLAGAFVSEGWNGDRSGFNNTDKVFFDSVLRAYHRAVGDAVYTGDTQLPSGKRLYSLDIHNQSELDATPLAELSGLKSANKRVPEFIWQSGTAAKQRFLQALFEGDGSCSQLGDSSIQVSYSTRSRQLASDVQQLLLEFGVLSRQVIYDKGEYKVVISNRHDAQMFAAQVGFLATKQTKLTGLLEALPAKTRGLTNDHVPFLREYVLDSSTCNRWVHKHNIDTYERWERDRELILEGIYDDETRQVATELLDAGYYYAEVAAIEDAGVQPVYSLKIDTDDHAFITDGFVSHNTEARMNSAAVEMVGEVFEDTVDFAPNFDGSEEEPTVLPSGIPNLLVNGVTGIAVGIATSIPPHNLQEVTEALTWMLEDADRIETAADEDIMQFIPAPDFPTGGQLVGLEDMAETYAKGGSVRIRATTNIEDVTARKRGIVVTELPYTVGPEKVITDIQKRVREKDIEGISDIKDLSDRKVGTKLVIECKAGYDPEAVRDRLFALTSLEKNYTVNMVALANGEPAELTLVDMCRHYVKHRLEVLVRRTTYRLGKAEDRAHIVEGLLKALDQIDLVVQTIRSSKNTKAAAKKLKKKLDLTDVQVSYILDMPLKRLTQLEGTKLEDELEDLNETIAGLKELLEDDGLQRQTVTDELQTVAGRYGRPRATAITDKDAVKRRHVKDATARIPDDPCVITLNIDGELGRMPTGGRKSRKKARRADILQSVCRTTNHSEFILLTDNGRGYVIDAIDLPEVERGGGNVHVGVVAPIGAAETPIAVVNPTETDVIAMATRNGILKRVKTDGLPVRAKDYDVISLDEDDKVVGAAQARDEDHLIVVSSDGQLLRTEASNVRPQGRTAGGVKGINLSKGAHAVTFGVWRHDHDEDTDGHQLVVLGTDNEGVKTSRLDIFPDKNRSTKGVRCIRLDVKGDQTVEVAWVGAGEPIALSASNRPKQVPDKLSKRASSANRLGNQALDLGFTRPKAYKET